MHSKTSFLLPWIVILMSASPGVGQETFEPNYDEDKIPAFELPDPLVLANGQQVTDGETWTKKRRPEILEWFTTQVYGRSPAPREDMHFKVTQVERQALDGKAIRKQVSVYFSADEQGPQMDVLIYLPAAATEPVPAFLA